MGVNVLCVSRLAVSTCIANGVTALLALLDVVSRGLVRPTAGAANLGHVEIRVLCSI